MRSSHKVHKINGLWGYRGFPSVGFLVSETGNWIWTKLRIRVGNYIKSWGNLIPVYINQVRNILYVKTNRA
jgi:hypothetical protein